MNRFPGKLLMLVLSIAVALCCTTVAHAQEDTGPPEQIDKSSTRVVLADVSGVPGSSVEVPIYFTPGAGVEVARLKIEITYISANLKYSKLDKGIDLGDLELHVDVKDGKTEKGVDTQTLTIIASYPKPPDKGIPEGLLGYLTMKISDTGKTANISLRTTAEANEVGTNKLISKIRAINGKVEVEAAGQPAAVSCFFFSH